MSQNFVAQVKSLLISSTEVKWSTGFHNIIHSWSAFMLLVLPYISYLSNYIMQFSNSINLFEEEQKLHQHGKDSKIAEQVVHQHLDLDSSSTRFVCEKQIRVKIQLQLSENSMRYKQTSIQFLTIKAKDPQVWYFSREPHA